MAKPNYQFEKRAKELAKKKKKEEKLKRRQEAKNAGPGDSVDQDPEGDAQELPPVGEIPTASEKPSL